MEFFYIHSSLLLYLLYLLPWKITFHLRHYRVPVLPFPSTCHFLYLPCEVTPMSYFDKTSCFLVFARFSNILCFKSSSKIVSCCTICHIHKFHKARKELLYTLKHLLMSIIFVRDITKLSFHFFAIVSGAVSSKSRINLDAFTRRQIFAFASILYFKASLPGSPTKELIINFPG